MSLFRSSSFRIKKREKAHRPPPLEDMPEHPKREAAESRTSFELAQAPSSFLTVPDSARSAFFTLPSAGNSRSSLFTRSASASGATSSSSSGIQEDKPRSSFFKLSNLSRGSFVSTLRREREPKGRNTLEALKSFDDTTASFTRLSIDLQECGYIPSSRRPESTVSMTNLLTGLDVIDIAPQPNSSLRQRSRTLSTKSAPGTPDAPLDFPLRLYTDLSPTHTASLSRSSLDTPSRRRTHMTIPPRLSLDTPVSPGSGSRTSPILPPLLTAPLPALRVPPGRLDNALPPLPSESLEVTKVGSHSPSPTIISATTVSTVRDSLLSSFDQSSSESDPDQSFAPGEEECAPIDMPYPSIVDKSVFNAHEQTGDPSTEATPPRLTVTWTGDTPSPKPFDLPHFSFPGPPALPPVLDSPSQDPFKNYLNVEDGSDVFGDKITPLETVTFKIKPKPGPSESPAVPARRFSTDALRAGNTSPARRLKIRRLGGASLSVMSSLQSRAEELIEETPPTPSTPSFLIGLAWPRPPFRRIYLDANRPEASWHTVSNVTNEKLFDGSGNARVGPCHIIMLAQAIDSFAQPQTQQDTCNQQPLSPAASSALAAFALHSRPLVSA